MLVHDVYCQRSQLYIVACLFFGQLNLGPVLTNHSFLASFENKGFSVFPEDGVVNVEFGGVGGEGCYWVESYLIDADKRDTF